MCLTLTLVDVKNKFYWRFFLTSTRVSVKHKFQLWYFVHVHIYFVWQPVCLMANHLLHLLVTWWDLEFFLILEESTPLLHILFALSLLICYAVTSSINNSFFFSVRFSHSLIHWGLCVYLCLFLSSGKRRLSF